MLRAVIFDMDGLLIDSEPLWWEAEIEGFARVGLRMTPADCAQTTGVRIDEVVAQRFRERPWTGASQAQVTAGIVARVIALIGARGEAKPGVAHAVDGARRRGLRLALASSSPLAIIEAVLARLGLAGAFEVVCSAEHEPLGKPHPGVYLTTAARLGEDPRRCLAVEDSLNGVIAAKAARMRCLAVPDTHAAGDPRLALADRVLPSLADLDDEVWTALGA